METNPNVICSNHVRPWMNRPVMIVSLENGDVPMKQQQQQQKQQQQQLKRPLNRQARVSVCFREVTTRNWTRR